MRFKEHCEQSEKSFGKDYAHVHRWLDECAWDGGIFNPFHRIFRHNSAGVETVRKKWGDEAAEAAKQHIISDEGCVPDDDSHYKKQYHLELL